jgi:hypothetical protein
MSLFLIPVWSFWNTGMLELWNDGFNKGIFSNYKIDFYPRPNIPKFHYSIVSKPLRNESEE